MGGTSVHLRWPFADRHDLRRLASDGCHDECAGTRVSRRRHPERGLSDRPGASLHGPADRGENRGAITNSRLSFAPAWRGKGNDRTDPCRRHRSQSYQRGADRNFRTGHECVGDAVFVSLHRAFAESPGWPDRRRNPGQLRALRIRRPRLLRFRRKVDLQQRQADPHDRRHEGPEASRAAIGIDVRHDQGARRRAD